MSARHDERDRVGERADPPGSQGPRTLPQRAGCVGKSGYMAIMSLDPTGKGQARWTMRWKTALNAFDITFDGRLSAAPSVTPTSPVGPLV
jgi:hypothetical protein